MKWKIHVLGFKNYIEEMQSTYSISEIINSGYFLIDYKSLLLNEKLISQWENLLNELVNNTEYCLKCMGLAMHQFIVDFYKNKSKEEENENIDNFKLKVIHPRIINFEPVLHLKEMKVNYFGKKYIYI